MLTCVNPTLDRPVILFQDVIKILNRSVLTVLLQNTVGFELNDGRRITPLRAYREPEGSEDDLTGTDLNVKFYDYLAALPDDRQVIIVENTDPPASIATRPQVVMFSKNPHSGRYGFFPIAETTAMEEPTASLEEPE